MPRWQAVVFDLDDTLFWECDYVRSGFRHVAAWCAARANAPEDRVFSFLWDAFESSTRGDTFDRLLGKFADVRDAGIFTADLVAAYRAHPPQIAWTPGVAELLADLHARGVFLGLISDGPLASQQAKASALGAARFFDRVVLTDGWGRAFWKPHPRAFETIMECCNLRPSDFVYVADNPVKDFAAPKRLGWGTVRFRAEPQQHSCVEPATDDYAAEHEVRSMEALRALLEVAP